MLHLETALYVRIQELPQGPKPLPLQSGFNMHTAYRALGIFNPSETSDAYFILSNDRNETWFICNRHVRTVALLPESREFRQPLSGIAPSPPTADSTKQRQPVDPDEGMPPIPPAPEPAAKQHCAAPFTSVGQD